MKSLLFFALSSCAVLSGSSATVRDVIVRSHWPWDNKVDVHYVLETDRPVDISLTATTNGAPMTIPAAALSGDLMEAETGTHRITLDPTKAGLTAAALENFVATVTPTTAKTYMIVDLSDDLANTVAARVTYTNEVIGTKTASNADATWKLWDDYYKTNAIVFRRCLPTVFTMGSPVSEPARASGNAEVAHQVRLTRTYYFGVFQVTQKQYCKVMGLATSPAKFNTTDWEMRPIENVGWNQNRGETSWPNDDLAVAHKVKSDGFLGMFRALTGNELYFDFPTDAQWENASRAGTYASYHNGKNGKSSAVDDPELDKLARNFYNGGNTTDYTIAAANGGTAIVGSYQPNNWGIYDTLGNAFEYCLDWYADVSADSVVDPVGPASGTARIRRGGHAGSGSTGQANRCACAARSSNTPATWNPGKFESFRLSVTLY